jgi:hypothetical protein
MLQVLRKSNPKLRKILLRNCDPEIIKTICEIAINTLNGNIKVSKNNFAEFKKHKIFLRKLACPKSSLKSKRKIIVQKGGFLPALLGTVISGVIGNLLSKYV